MRGVKLLGPCTCGECCMKYYCGSQAFFENGFLCVLLGLN